MAKGSLHPQNPHSTPYDFAALIKTSPDLARFVVTGLNHAQTIDFADPAAVKALNKALLHLHYGIVWWDIPDGCLCPPVPGRADYIHYAADVLAGVSHGSASARRPIRVLDIGTGANCIFPLIGNRTFGWNFVGTDCNSEFLQSAQKIIDNNPPLQGAVELRLQVNPADVFRQVIKSDDFFDLTICNPPFHGSEQLAEAANLRRLSKMNLPPVLGRRLNFGGKHSELWCAGGEVGFIQTMISQSVEYRDQCRWFSTLVSRRENLPGIYRQLRLIRVNEIRTVSMSQGQKISRMVVWSFSKNPLVY